jgi:hypothetical protein
MGVEEIILENEIPLSNSSFINSHPQILYEYMNSFFESLILDVPLDNEVIAQEKNKSLKEIITNIFSDKNFESKDFTKIGFFKTNNDSKFFKIHLRKLYFKEEVIEILINDFTEVKLAVNQEFGDGNITTTNTYQGGGASFKNSTAIERTSATAGVGLNISSDNVSFNIGYEADVREKYLGHSAQAKITAKF